MTADGLDRRCGHYLAVHNDEGHCHASAPCGCRRFTLRFPGLAR